MHTEKHACNKRANKKFSASKSNVHDFTQQTLLGKHYRVYIVT